MMHDLVQHLPCELLEDIATGECLPVVGAGLSKHAILPPMCQMPLWDDLVAAVAGRMGKPFAGNPTETLSQYCDERTRFELVRFLRKSLHIDTARPGTAHIAFARLPFRQVLTTNFDLLLEQVLRQPKDRMIYEYDFGDGWEHDVVVEKLLPIASGRNPYPRVTGGRRACPPENCGGIPGYYHLLDVLNTPDHPERGDLLEWCGGGYEPARFDLREVNRVFQGG